MTLLTSPRWPTQLPRLSKEVIEEPPSEQAVMISHGLAIVSALLLLLLVNITLVSQVQHFNAQHRLYGQFRQHLAEGSVPIGQTDVNGNLVKPGTPMALLTIPELGLREIVVEGTSSADTMKGVGHRRDTPLPGQPGVSVLMGRSGAYGAPFAHLSDLKPGQEVTVQTGQGISTYKVLGTRGPHTMLPALQPDQGRLTLITASGARFLPSGVTRVDAELVSTAFPAPAAVLPPNGIRGAEQALHGDTAHAFALSWLALLFLLLIVAAVWSWKQWSKPATWIAFVPLLAFVGLAVANDVCTFLPNLI